MIATSRMVNCDVVIVGAGVAGLSAAASLKRGGKDVQCLEATNRIGGRILTIHDSLAPLPIELGAEFVHGRPPAIWDLIRNSGLTAYEHGTRLLHLQRGQVMQSGGIGEISGDILSRMARSIRKKDESFEDYLRRSRQRSDAKTWARIYVEGFNAARTERISVASLTEDAEAADKIEGDRAFRILNGYDSIPTSLLHLIPDYQSTVHLQSIVERVTWQPGIVDVEYQTGLDNRKAVLRCRHLIVTVPLGVLQASDSGAGRIQFDPEPAGILRAARSLEFGQVYRVTLRFQRAFWEEDERFKRVGFMVSKDKRFFTWWTAHPVMAPLLTGWMAGSAADQFQISDPSQIASEALASLGRILDRKIPPPEAFYFHDWRADPFFRGAYSYVPAGMLAARKALSTPVDGTLFFAGEAAETMGHSGTVHGAIASGRRAAHLIQQQG